MKFYINPYLVARVREERKKQGSDCTCGGCELCEACKLVLSIGLYIMDCLDHPNDCAYCMSNDHSVAEHQEAAEAGVWIIAVQRCKLVHGVCERLGDHA